MLQVVSATFYDCINTIYMYQIINPFLDNKMSIFEDYGPFNIFFLFLYENICCGYSLEKPCQNVSYKYPQHIFVYFFCT